MQMKDGLARAGTVVEDRAIAVEEVTFAGEFGGNQMQLADHRLIFVRRVVQRDKMLSRDEQNVRGCLRADVLECQELRVFVNDFGRNLLRGNFAKQAVGTHQFPPPGAASSRRTTNGVNPSRPRSCSPSWCAASSPEILPTRTR